MVQVRVSAQRLLHGLDLVLMGTANEGRQKRLQGAVPDTSFGLANVGAQGLTDHSIENPIESSFFPQEDHVIVIQGPSKQALINGTILLQQARGVET